MESPTYDASISLEGFSIHDRKGKDTLDFKCFLLEMVQITTAHISLAKGNYTVRKVSFSYWSGKSKLLEIGENHCISTNVLMKINFIYIEIAPAQVYVFSLLFMYLIACKSGIFYNKYQCSYYVFMIDGNAIYIYQ